MSNNATQQQRTATSNEKQRTTRSAGASSSLPLRTYRRVMKTPDGNDGPRPGAYDVAGRAHGEVPSWIQRPRRRQNNTAAAAANQEPQQAQFVKHVVADAEVVAADDSDAIVAASVVIERRIGFSRLRNLGRRQQRQPAQQQQLTQSDRAIQQNNETNAATSTRSEDWNTLDDSVGDAHGKRRSTNDLLEDNQDDALLQDRFLQGLQSAARAPVGDTDEEFTEAHPHVQSVLEVFPDSNIKRIMELLRQESLATTLICLAEESLEKPSDDIFPTTTELQHCTTYAQATDRDRELIMSYLKDMFPHISKQQITNVLMKHSTHQGVAILSSDDMLPGDCTAALKPPPAASGPKRQSLIDSDEEEDLELLDLQKIPWMPPQNIQHHSMSPRLEMKKSASYSDLDKKKAAIPSSSTTTTTTTTQYNTNDATRPPMNRQRSASYGTVMALVLTESRQDALMEQRNSWDRGLNHDDEDNKPRVNPTDFYDLNALKRSTR